MSQKELKQPDKFRRAVSDAIFVLSENYKKILAAVGFLLIAGAGILALDYQNQKNELGANSIFSEAVKKYEGGEKLQALDRFLSLTTEYPEADISKIALYYSANINYEQGNYDQTIKLLNDFLSTLKSDEVLRESAYLMLGAANFNKGDWEKAVEALSRLDKDGSLYRDQAKFLLAVSLDKLGRFDEAEEMRKTLPDEYSANNPAF